MRHTFQKLAIALFCLYLALFPGSTLTVALDRVPAWGAWMGGALLMLQGAIVLCWLLGRYRRRGAVAALLVLLLAWGVEHVGATTGAPFGRYRYTEALQPQLLGVVPLAIACAWLMVAVGAWQLAANDQRPTTNDQRPMTDHRPPTADHHMRGSVVSDRRSMIGKAATLIVLLDLQIETVATAVNRYWVWSSGGPYYGVPTANFVSWWLLGAGMASLLTWVLCQHCEPRDSKNKEQRTKNKELSTEHQEPRTKNQEPTNDQRLPTKYHALRFTFYALRFTFYASRIMHHASRFMHPPSPIPHPPSPIPAYLYILSTVMFTVVNLARGYGVAGAVGVVVLLAAALRVWGGRRGAADARAARRTPD